MTLSMRAAPHHDLSDAALAEYAGAGDEGAFEALDRRHRSTLLRHCDGILRNRHDAEEAVQGVFLKAYRALSSGQRPASLLPWLLVIARNECFDIIRARRRTEEIPLHTASSEIRPDELVVHREDARVLRADIKALPPAQRAALVLRSMGDLPHGEIARLLGGTPTEARTLCHEARLSLAECKEGRSLECSEVLERIESGDGRALRARRIKAHLRACEGCQEAAARARAPRRSGLGALFPLPWFGALRSLLFGGGTTGAVGGAGSVAMVGVPIVAAVTLAVGVAVGVTEDAGGSTHAHASSVPTKATSTPPASVPRAAPRSPSGGASSPERTAAAGSSTPAASVPERGAAGSAVESIPASRPSSGLQTPGVSVPGTGITVPSVELPTAPTPSIPAPPIRVPVVGVTLPGVQVPVAPSVSIQTPALPVPPVGVTVPGVHVTVGPTAGAGGGEPSPIVAPVGSAAGALAPITKPVTTALPGVLP